MVVVSKYKDEGLRSLYLEHENGEYEYLCDAAHSKYVIVTECGIYYFPDLSEEIWYFDFNTKLAKKVYTGGIGNLEEMNLINYDEEYIYIAGEISVGLDEEGFDIYEGRILRIPRDSGEAEIIYHVENYISSHALFKKCAVVSGKIIMDDENTYLKPVTEYVGANR